MNRTGLLIALAIAVVVGVVFAIWPGLDPALSSPFYDTAGERGLGSMCRWRSCAIAASWLIALVVAPAIVALVVKLVLPRRPLLLPGRAIVLMISTLAIGPASPSTSS